MRSIRKLVLLSYLFTASHSFGQCPVLPTPVSYELLDGRSFLDDGLKVNLSAIDSFSANYLKREFTKLYAVALIDDTSKFALHFHRVENNGGPQYGIAFEPENKLISYARESDLFYAINSLLQLVKTEDERKYIEHCLINDYPRFEWRGLHFDVSRHFFTVNEVKRFIDLMAHYKFNVFHWHLTDDQGWRIEINKYPKLTEIGAWRDSTVIGHYSDSPRRYERERYGGFYTQAEIKEVIAYASERHVTVVPEIEMPGHSRAALAAYPEYSCTGQHQPVPGLWGVFDDIYCSKDESIQFMQDILAEVIELFPSEYIHIGGDEAPKKSWEECPNCKKVMDANHLEDVHELQSYFIKQIDGYLTAKGKKLIGWDEILEGGLSPNAAVMSWRGIDGGIEAAEQNHFVVMSPTSHCYFDYYQSGNVSEPLAIGGYLPLEKVYEFTPIPNHISPEAREFIIGGQANVWTEYISNFEQVEYMVYPRALALIQGLWCYEKPTYDKFLSSYLTGQEEFLSRLDVNFAKSIHYPELVITQAEKGVYIKFKTSDSKAIYDVTSLMSNNIDTYTYMDAFVLKAGDSVLLQPSEGDKMKSIRMRLNSTKFDTPLEYSFMLHSSLGVNVKLETNPHEKYNHGGGLTLVDGVYGRRPWKGDQWLGFREKEIVFEITYDEPISAEAIEISFLKDNGSWIYLPETAEIAYSKNGKCWKKIKKRTENWDGEKLRNNLGVKAQYFKVSIQPMDEVPAGKPGEGGIPWTFIDEVQLIQTTR